MCGSAQRNYSKYTQMTQMSPKKKWEMRPTEEAPNWTFASMMRSNQPLDLLLTTILWSFNFYYSEMSKPTVDSTRSHIRIDQRQELEETQSRGPLSWGPWLITHTNAEGAHEPGKSCCALSQKTKHPHELSAQIPSRFSASLSLKIPPLLRLQSLPSSLQSFTSALWITACDPAKMEINQSFQEFDLGPVPTALHPLSTDGGLAPAVNTSTFMDLL